jgi:hypothetical protein
MSRLVIYTERELTHRLKHRKTIGPNDRFGVSILNVWCTLRGWVEAEPTIGEKMVTLDVRKFSRHLGKDTFNLVALTVKIEK